MNTETADAIREAKSGKYAGKLCMDNLETFRKSIEEEGKESYLLFK
jgi:hypothetical protein